MLVRLLANVCRLHAHVRIEYHDCIDKDRLKLEHVRIEYHDCIDKDRLELEHCVSLR